MYVTQKNWKSLAKGTLFIKNLIAYYNGKGLVVPRIQRPITEQQERKVDRRMEKIGITWRNAVKRYINIRKYVQKLILKN